MKAQKSFVKGRTQAVAYVFRGMRLMFGEHSFMVQFSLMILTVLSGIYMDFSLSDWALFSLAWGGIFTTETMNTSVERLADVVSPDFDERIRDVKDLSAGAVGWAALAGLAVYLFLIFKHV